MALDPGDVHKNDRVFSGLVFFLSWGQATLPYGVAQHLLGSVSEKALGVHLLFARAVSPVLPPPPRMHLIAYWSRQNSQPKFGGFVAAGPLPP